MYRLNPGSASDTEKRDLPQSRGPREKLAEGNLPSLSERELLSLVIGKGSPGVPLLDLVETIHDLIFQSDGRATAPELEVLQKIRGLGTAKASAIIAALELGRRCRTSRGRPILDPLDALPHISWMGRCRRERFQVLYLDTRRRLISSQTLSLGTLEASLVHPREVFRPAVKLGASAILVAHNHPSGDPEPSAEDLALTSRLDRAARLLGFHLLDHLVIGADDWVSLRQKQMDGESGLELFAA